MEPIKDSKKNPDKKRRTDSSYFIGFEPFFFFLLCISIKRFESSCQEQTLNLPRIPPRIIFTFFVFHCYRSSVVRADGVSAGGPERGGHVGSGAAELWRAAEGRLPQLPVHRPQPPGHGHAGVLHRGGALRWLYLGPAGTQSSGQSQTRSGWWAEGDWPAGGSRTVWLSQFSHSLVVVINLKQQETGV